MSKLIFSIMLITLFFGLSGCEEGPFGNTPPQGRPDWMKDKNKP
jgi:hypothetical protein